VEVAEAATVAMTVAASGAAAWTQWQTSSNRTRRRRSR